MHHRRLTASTFTNYFLLFVSFAILSPYLQLFLKARGMSPSRIGVLLGLLELAGIAGPLLLGRLADSRSAYRGLLAACFGAAVLAFLPMQLTTLFPVFAACIAVLGFAYRSVIPLMDSLVSRTLPDPARQYGRMRVAGSLGFIAISLVMQASGLATGSSSLAIMAVFGASAAAAALAVTLMPAAPRTPPAAHAPSAPRETAPAPAAGRDGFDARFWAVIGIIFLGRFALGSYYSFFSLYLQQTFPDTGVSMLWAIGPLAEIGTIWFSGPLIRRFGIRAMFIVSLAAISVRLGLFIVAPSIVVVALAQLLHAFTFGTFHTTAVAFVNQKVDHGRRGMGMAIYNAIGCGLGGFLASVTGGYLIESRGFAFLFGAYGLLPLVGILALALFGRRLLDASAKA
jgi:MFS transporter, PPP family, 3-phenylpropionic acid transporter